MGAIITAEKQNLGRLVARQMCQIKAVHFEWKENLREVNRHISWRILEKPKAEMWALKYWTVLLRIQDKAFIMDIC